MSSHRVTVPVHTINVCRATSLRTVAVLWCVLTGCISSLVAGNQKAMPLPSAAPDSAANVMRIQQALDRGWRYHSGDVAGDAGARVESAGWQEVMIPHCWNAWDGADGGTTKTNWGYRRGVSWYARELVIPKLENGRRAFLLFEGASIVTDVYLNGIRLGQHRGAFGAFSFEITQCLDGRGTNDLRVRVDNSFVDDVPPQQGDFTMFGGLYRPVRLLVTAGTCITPLDYASPGIALVQREVSRERATVDAEVKLSRPTNESEAARIRLTLADAGGRTLLVRVAAVRWAGSDGEVHMPLSIDRPHLWQGRLDPYLYTVRVEVLVNDRAVDSVTQGLGLRSIRIDPEKGFFLNDEPYPLRGVCRHQDRAGKGWAISEANQRQDLELILDMGANAVRAAHYPHSPFFYELCDRAGLIVWAEIPLVNVVRNTDAFHANTRLQLIEMIRQHRNHPSIAVWGLFNELYHQGPSDPCETLVAELNSIAKREDPTRPTVAASNQRSRKQLNAIPDFIAFNGYPGWYGNGGPAGMKDSIDAWLKATSRSSVGVSEYGAGGSVKQHEEWPPKKPQSDGPWHPEEYQAYCHEAQYRAIQQHPAVWGAFVWNMFDFGSDDRAEGDQPGINDKGLITYDRQTKKDAFFFYKANWNPEPMVHIASQRFVERRQPDTTVRVYSNCDQVELFVNGRSLGKITPDKSNIAAWHAVTLAEGDNRIQAVGFTSSGNVTNSCAWRLSSATVREGRTQAGVDPAI